MDPREQGMNFCPISLVSIVIISMFILDLMDDEEEVLIALAEVLGTFLDYTGGPA